MAIPSGATGKEPFLPRTLTVLREGYDGGTFFKDLAAGLTVGIVALPLAMAFAIASGTTPERGLFTAIVAGFLISLLGGSRYQIGGPTGAFVIIIFNVIMKHGYDGLVVTTLLAGAMLLVFGLCRFGALIKYIPYPVTTGFTAGIAVLIFSQQVKDFLGLSMQSVPPDFFEKWQAYIHNAATFDPATCGIAFLALGAIILTRKTIPRIPGPVVGVVLASLTVWALGLDVETIGSRFGGIPTELPTFTLPTVTLERVRQLLPDAMTIALLAGIESLLSCVVADGMTGDKHNSNVELAAQGAANIASVMFGGIPATGAIARTVTNIRSGGRTPVAGMIHAAVLVGFILYLAPLASFIPLASLAAVLMVVAWDMSEMHKFLRLLHAPKSDVLVMCLTFALTVVIDLTVAVYVGVMLASLLFMRRMSEVTQICTCLDGEATKVQGRETAELDVPEGVKVYEIDGPFFFGVADRFQNVLAALDRQPEVFILRMRKVSTLDSTAVNALEVFWRKCRSDGTQLLLSGVRETMRTTLRRMGTLSLIGEGNICENIDAALARAGQVLAERREAEDRPQ
ncbi:SulP family inorganic anion transporter [Nitratidesulfovibrio vulgaris]|uniref:Sulfate permease family protein n=1 Tax=Nitratidesulfovibrio vulgaris (strain ATCC 29579 / DSM 644 / CCUG 34227 / NCIMB 8303 / VKM B-1760 / Hildenborough) TaxID=882 RepID=Q72FD5_NITV2|nr:sulfate permease [Nitratidesulfovibrio vulgaris]AAS94762.1 sulfate permease family protein [Nitratidesulfovibrio vulgaris str. Hildenborough]ADP85421.1 sulfate transporter [Nitratidesulfovibrio vulgaris RCH1]